MKYTKTHDSWKLCEMNTGWVQVKVGLWDQGDGSVSKGACCQAEGLTLTPRNQSVDREDGLLQANGPLTPHAWHNPHATPYTN